MLILSRKVGESLMIGDDVEIKVLTMAGNQIKFGITAPDDTPIHRLEIWRRIQEKLARGEE